jgi:Zn-dependent protease
MITTDLIYDISVWLLPVLIAITFHEAAHGYVARFLGDDAASRLGRVSLNPVRHIDPFGTIILPGLLLIARSPFLFGYAKPVPVNFRARPAWRSRFFGTSGGFLFLIPPSAASDPF